MINTGHGKYQIVDEGQLSFVPPPKRIIKYPKRIRKRPKAKNFTTSLANIAATVPGWGEWRSRSVAELLSMVPRHKRGRPVGVPDGETKQSIKETLAGYGMTILDENELQSIKDTIALETNPIVRLLMRQHVEIVIGPYSLKDKFVAMKELMAYTKAKPANVTELKVTDTQDAFADLMEEIAGKGK